MLLSWDLTFWTIISWHNSSFTLRLTQFELLLEIHSDMDFISL